MYTVTIETTFTERYYFQTFVAATTFAGEWSKVASRVVVFGVFGQEIFRYEGGRLIQ